MSPLTDDPTDPRLGHGVDETPIPQHEVYLVLSEEERAKGFVRPYCENYLHVGASGPRFPLRDLSADELERYGEFDYVKFEEYPDDVDGLGRFWTQQRLDNVGRGCRTVTHMGTALSETYARQPSFYGATYCVGCSRHLAVGADGEFVWCRSDGTPLERDGAPWKVGT